MPHDSLAERGIDEELMFVRAMDDIDAWHIALLDHMAQRCRAHTR